MQILEVSICIQFYQYLAQFAATDEFEDTIESIFGMVLRSINRGRFER
jgi:hypothetical protein